MLFAAAELGRADIIGKAIESLTAGKSEINSGALWTRTRSKDHRSAESSAFALEEPRNTRDRHVRGALDVQVPQASLASGGF